MTIYDSNNQAVLTVEVSDESYAYNEIMGDKRLHLEFELPTFVEIPVGSHVDFHYETYYLLKPESLKLVHRRNWEYVIEFEGLQEVLKTLVYQNPDDHRVEFPVTGKAQDHLDILVRCINGKDGRTWTATADSSLTLDKLVSYSFNNCKEALQAIAEAFETEWEVVGTAIYLRKVEYNKTEALSMSYGKGNGLRTGINRKNYNDEIPLTTVYVKGDDRNIGYYVDANNQTVRYGDSTLHLPKSAVGGYDGEHFSWESGYSSTNAMSFAVSADGYSVSDSGATGRNEGILDCTDIYPKYEGTVSKVATVDAEKHLYDFWDNNASCPDYSQLATEETMTVIFQSGMLAGREFDVNCKGSTADGIHYEIVPVEQDGMIMPGDNGYVAAVGNKYIIFHSKLPYQYINDATNHSGAEWDMLKTVVKYLYEARNPRYSITGELDPLWSSTQWSVVGPKIKIGGYVSFTDPSFQADSFLVRIQSVRHYVNKPYKPVITLANTPTKGSVASQIRSLERDSFYNELQNNENRQFTKRTFASAKATMDALAEFFEDYSDAIKPIGIQTMQMIVGDERLQTEFSRNASDFLPTIAPPVYWDAGLVCGSGTKAYVRNQNIDDDCEIITTISGAHEHYQWPCKSETLTTDAYGNALVDNKQYYLYLYATKNNNGNNSTSWKLFPVGEANSVLDFYDSARGQYNFFVGILNMMEDETRQFVPVCGFTEITPGGITTSRIQDPNANSWLDLATGEFSWGNGAITYNPVTNQTTYTGQVTIGAGSTGLSNLEGYNNLANKTDISDLQLQVDGKINTYHQDTNPATWSASDNSKHVGDLWSDSSNNNVVYRYTYYSGTDTYGWASLKDGDIPTALALASAKRRVFTTQPIPPYDVNDLWLNSGKLYVCVNAKAEGGSYSSSDWEQGLLFDVNDKAEVQREWQRIHGAADLGTATDAGTYIITKNVAVRAGYGEEEDVTLVYNGDSLTYNGYPLVYKASGTSTLDSAYNALKTYLTTAGLYDGNTEWAGAYDAQELTNLLVAYYAAETSFLANAQFSLVSELDYLKAALPSGATTDIAGGVVLSSVLGVRNGNGNVTAGMDGTADNDSPMLWAGSSNAQTRGNAKWKVYKDGKTVLTDANGSRSTIIDGNEYDFDNIFGTDTTGISMTGGSSSETHTVATDYSDAEFTVETGRILQNLTVSKDGTFSFPSFTLSGEASATVSSTLNLWYGQVSLCVDGVPIATLSEATGGTQFSQTYSGVQMFLAAGTHRISITGEFNGQAYSDEERTATFTATVAYSGTGTHIVEQKVAYLCANGFMVGESSTSYMKAEVDANGMNYYVINGNAGVQVYNGALKLRIGGTWYSASVDNGYLKLT